jgi:hypothetical protein
MKSHAAKFEWIAVAALVALAVALRLAFLGDSPFRADTMEFYKMALRNQDIFQLWANPPWLNQIPLSETWTLLLVRFGLPPTPFVVRLPFALMGIGAVVLVWAFARRWFGRGAALSALFIAALNPYQLYYSRTAYHYSGVVFWSLLAFIAFWRLKETMQAGRRPKELDLFFWFAAAALACLTHMSTWAVTAFQGLFLGILGWRTVAPGSDRRRFLAGFVVGGLAVAAVMARWILRAVGMLVNDTEQIGSNAAGEFLRLLPAYLAGETVPAIALLAILAALVALAIAKTRRTVPRFASLAWIGVAHVLVVMLYVAAAGGGLAKIAYFSAIWPHVVLVLGVGAFLGAQTFANAPARRATLALLAAGYAALVAAPDWAILRIEGKPTPYYKINQWVLDNLPENTPVLLDRWYEPWNELAIHNAPNIPYTFTVPDEPLDNYLANNWPATAEQFFAKYPDAALIRVCETRYAGKAPPWTFPDTYFARMARITNDPAMTLRHFKIFPGEEYSAADTNRIIVPIYYNTLEDLQAAAIRRGESALRLFGEGWEYAKPGWQAGHFEDYRIMRQSATVHWHNVTSAPLRGHMEIFAASAEKPKMVSVGGTAKAFSPNRLEPWTIPLVLEPGHTPVAFRSSTPAPLFVADIRWVPAPPAD